ncbi:MAG: hypothetical protein U0529_13555 [Thermoanaerobaculia bacterium]
MAILASIVALLLAGTAMAEAPAPGWYRGLVGRTATALDTPERYEKNKEVEMELRIDDAGRVSGRYFYFDAVTLAPGADIAIEGRVTPEGKVQLEEKVGGKVTGRWRGSDDGAELSGTWTDPSGRRKLRFVLERVDDREGEEHAVTPQVAYRGRRVVGTNLQLPFLTRHPRPEVMKTVNDRISASFQGHRCEPTMSPDDFDVTWEVRYASVDLFSVEVSEGWFCNAAYPSAEPRSFTYDLRTGREVEFADLFQNYEAKKDAILEALFADAAASRDEECKEAAASWPESDAGPGAKPAPGPRLLGDSIRFHLTPTVLHVVEVGLPHVIAACRLSADVPYEKLRQFVAPGSPVALIADAKKPAK